MNASCGMSTEPIRFMRFLPSFCFSSSLRLRATSPHEHSHGSVQLAFQPLKRVLDILK